MSDQRVSREGAGGDVARLLHAAARERLRVALADLFLPVRLRLTEWHRATMAALLERLIRSIEHKLRMTLAVTFPANERPELHVALTTTHVEIALPILMRSPALRDGELVMLLFRRVEEHRLYRASNRTQAPDGLVAELVRDQDPIVAEAAMALLIARSRRLDRFQEPAIASPELPAELSHRICWTIAAALRTYLVDRHGVVPDEADRALTKAVLRRLRSDEEGEGLERRSMTLAKRLDDLGRIDGRLVTRSLAEGGLPLLLALLAQRCDLDLDAVWEVLSEPEGRGAPLLLRAAGLDHEEAGTLLVGLAANAAGSEDEQLARQFDLFSTVSRAEAQVTTRFWRLDPAYRAAIAAVATPAAGAPA